MWRQGPNTLRARHGHACVSIMGSNNKVEKVIAISGSGRSVEVLDVKKMQFAYGLPLPTTLIYPSAVAAKMDNSFGFIYLFGGHNQEKRARSSSIYVTSMDMSTMQKWEIIGNMSKPREPLNAVLLPDVFTSDCDRSRGTWKLQLYLANIENDL